MKVTTDKHTLTSVGTISKTVLQEGVPVLVLTKHKGISQNNEKSLCTCDGHIETFGISEKTQVELIVKLQKFGRGANSGDDNYTLLAT